MIGKLSGRVDARFSDYVLIDVGGVGYLVFAGERTLASLSEGEFVTLYTELVVREDLMQLFGFLSPLEKEWHKLLTTVQGVGAKAALAIQNALGTEGVARAIALGDIPAIKSAPGVGPKLAQRIATELKDKAPSLMGAGPTVTRAAMSDVIDSGDTISADALSALTNLGYAPADAAAAVAGFSSEATDTGDLIKRALKELGPKA